MLVPKPFLRILLLKIGLLTNFQRINIEEIPEKDRRMIPIVEIIPRVFQRNIYLINEMYHENTRLKILFWAFFEAFPFLSKIALLGKIWKNIR